MLMTSSKKLRIYQYWSTDPLLQTPFFASVKKRNRFFYQVLHFCDNQKFANGDKLYKIIFIVDSIKMKFHEIFEPFQNVCIDENLALFKGRLTFKQYIKCNFIYCFNIFLKSIVNRRHLHPSQSINKMKGLYNLLQDTS